jgi:hypothetical protein
MRQGLEALTLHPAEPRLARGAEGATQVEVGLRPLAGLEVKASVQQVEAGGENHGRTPGTGRHRADRENSYSRISTGRNTFLRPGRKIIPVYGPKKFLR